MHWLEHVTTVATVRNDQHLVSRNAHESYLHELKNAGVPVHSRVHPLRDDAGAICVSEVELIEPALYLRVHDAAVTMFADLIERQLTESPAAAAQTVPAK